jgi:TATA-box binding protein (TBP) (component of TFIID and TFIIIB)
MNEDATDFVRVKLRVRERQVVHIPHEEIRSRSGSTFCTLLGERRMYTNILCTADLGCIIDLRSLTMTNRNIRYNPQIFNGAIWNHPRIGGCCLVFANGNMCVNGKAKTPIEARKRVRRYARLVQELGGSVSLKHIEM